MDQTLRGEARRTHRRLVELETTIRRARTMIERVLDELDADLQDELFPDDPTGGLAHTAARRA